MRLGCTRLEASGLPQALQVAHYMLTYVHNCKVRKPASRA